MTRPNESDYNSQVAYTRALEAYCDSLAQRQARSADTWVGLTDEEIDAIYSANGGTRTRRQIYQAIEAKLKKKNT